MSVKSVDHLSELLKSLGETPFDNLKLHRTKCTMVIKYVIAESLKNDDRKYFYICEVNHVVVLYNKA